MNMEVRPPRHANALTIKSMMIAIVAIAVVFAVLTNEARSHARVQRVRSDFSAWLARVQERNRTLTLGGFTTGSSDGIFGSSFRWRGTYKTKTGRSIAVDFEFVDRPFKSTGAVVLTSEGRTATVAIDAVRLGQGLDLNALFPEPAGSPGQHSNK